MTTTLIAQLICLLFFGCLGATAALIPAVMWFARKVDAVDRGGYRKVFKGEMPLLGGLGIALPLIFLALASSLAGHFIVANWKWVYLHYEQYFDPLFSFAGTRRESLIVLAGGVGIILLGLVDDTRGMRARWKLLGQLAVAVFICMSGMMVTGVSVPFLGDVNLGGILGGFLTVLWIVGLINAFNLIDGVDGLAGAIAFVGAVSLVALSLIQGSLYVTFASAALAGSVMAFLFFNFPPARIFLGDTGSMFLGYSLATLSLMGAPKYETAVILFAPMLALSLPVFETFVSMLRRFLRGMPIFVGDNRHTHHRLLGKGFSQRKVVLTLGGAAFFLAAAAVFSILIPENSPAAWLPYVLYAATLLYIAWLADYFRPTAVKTTLERRDRNRLFQALGKYAALSLTANNASVNGETLFTLCRQQLGLTYLEVRVRNRDVLCISQEERDSGKDETSREELLVKSSEGEDIVIWYRFLQTPDEHTRQDVSSCLASIFDELNLAQAAILDHETQKDT